MSYTYNKCLVKTFSSDTCTITYLALYMVHKMCLVPGNLFLELFKI